MNLVCLFKTSIPVFDFRGEITTPVRIIGLPTNALARKNVTVATGIENARNKIPARAD
jgi:hypothetical protein